MRPTPPDRTSRFASDVGGVAIERIPPDLYVSAAKRIVREGSAKAARRFVDGAPLLGIDLSNMWGTLAPDRRSVNEVCLAIHGAGRTAMLFVSGAPTGSAKGRNAPDEPLRRQQRAAAIRVTCDHMQVGGMRLAQGLLEPDELVAVQAFEDAEFTSLGRLAYLRCTHEQIAAAPAMRPFDDSVSVRSVAELGRGTDAILRRALERTYVETLDCPELCGMRAMSDVVEAHRAVGVYDPNLWWIVFDHTDDQEEPEGCLLLNRCPDQGLVELVYLGLSPKLRGRAIAERVLAMGFTEIGRKRTKADITCAVDTRNTPAMKLYARFGFTEFGQRLPFVRGLAGV